ncbi:hypothetical protein ACS0TY_025733 [Phlomoides rotata]
MVYDTAKLAAQSSSAAYSPLKDMILYFKNKGKYVKELEDNLTKLTAEMGTFYSKKQQIDRVLERDVSKEKNDEYQILVTQFEVFMKKYNKFILKYSKHCQNLPSVPPEVEASTDVSTISSVIEALQTRKPTILTHKFFKLATLSKDISKLHGHISRVTNRMKAENVMHEKKVESVQVKHDDVDLPSFTKYVQKILSFLVEDENRSIGILGPIGVGKTSVMKMLNNQLKSLKFEVVIWINYSKQLDAEEKTIEMMQDVIMGRLKLNKEKENNTEQNADMISTALKHKKYILLIDQVSSAFDFDRVGIHKDHKFGKVVLASSSNKVIRHMTDTHVEVGPLSQKDSLDLFQEVCGKIYDLRIKLIAESIVASCGGLPQVIKLVAMHLKGETDEQAWSDVKRILQSEAKSARLLKLGEIGKAYKLVYDKLDKSYMKCLLFVALFPSGHKIYKDYLVECWKAERFLELNIPELRSARERGATVLKELTDQFLLENSSDMHVKMPVHFRTVALAQNYPGEENCIFWAPQKDRVLDAETWKTSKRMSLIGLKSKLPERPESKNMSTLLLQRNPHMATLGDLFFLNMQKLSILDLKQAGIKSLPSSIFSLINLTCLYLNDCSLLGELPSEVKELKKLEVFDIRGTSIRHLPKEVGDMSQLRCLRISFSQNGCNRKSKGKEVEMTIPLKIISRLQQLEELIIEVGCCCQGWNKIVDQLTEELTCLEKLNTLSFHFPTASGLKKFVTESKSLTNTETHWNTNTFRSFKISVGCCERQHPYGADLSGVFGERLLRFSNNEEISSVEEVLRQASSFELVCHSDVESLSEFSLENTGALKICILEKCKKLSSVVDTSKIHDKQVDSSGKTDCDVLQCLEKLHLFDLQLLKCLWKGSVFPRSLTNLKILTLFNCPELTEILTHELAKALSSIEHLKVEKCSKIVEIVKTQISMDISEPVDLSVLHKVKTIELVNLPELQSICKSTSMNWKSLGKIEIISCNKLKNLASTLRGGKLQMIKCEATWWEALVLPKEEKLHLSPLCEFIVLEQSLVVGTFHEGESSNHGRPADPQPSDTIVLKEHHDEVMSNNENGLSMSNIDSVVHAGKSKDQDRVEHENHQSTSTNVSTKDETLPLYKEGCSKVDTSISTH